MKFSLSRLQRCSPRKFGSLLLPSAGPVRAGSWGCFSGKEPSLYRKLKATLGCACITLIKCYWVSASFAYFSRLFIIWFAVFVFSVIGSVCYCNLRLCTLVQAWFHSILHLFLCSVSASECCSNTCATAALGSNSALPRTAKQGRLPWYFTYSCTGGSAWVESLHLAKTPGRRNKKWPWLGVSCRTGGPWQLLPSFRKEGGQCRKAFKIYRNYNRL